MHVPENVVDSLVTILQCKRDTFPQTYLGLPLSNNSKLRLSAFAPLIAKVDKYLAGWKATLLSPASRVVLINSVLDELTTYAMGALLLPVGVKEALDARRRSFLWNGSDKASAQCLVAWEKVCPAKEDGGLGIKTLDTQNACLLLKLIHRLHHPAESSWATWALQHIRLSNLQGDVDGPHWEALRDLLPAYRSILRWRSEMGRPPPSGRITGSPTCNYPPSSRPCSVTSPEDRNRSTYCRHGSLPGLLLISKSYHVCCSPSVLQTPPTKPCVARVCVPGAQSTHHEAPRSAINDSSLGSLR